MKNVLIFADLVPPGCCAVFTKHAQLFTWLSFALGKTEAVFINGFWWK
jgi:hypothetical protein